jgi:hypothetical protein
MGQKTLKVDKIVPEGGILHIDGQVTATSLQDVNGPWDPVNATDIKFDDGNVGIGTVAPAYKLDVHGTANVGVLTTTSVSGDGSGLTNIQKANIPGLIQEQWTTLNDDILYFQNSNVGIGTDTPAYKLDVHGSANVGALNVTSISGDGSGLTNIDGSAINNLNLVNQWTSDENDLRYEDGKVGVGKGTPNHTFDVNGNVNATSLSLSDSDIPVYLTSNASAASIARWANEIGGDTNIVRDVAIDSNGNAFVTGEYTSSASVEVGTGVSLSATTETNVYLIKYNSSGVAEWAINMIGRGNTVAIDPSGNVYISGSYESGSNINVPSTDGNPLIGKLVQTTRGATFLIKYNNAGVAQWATRVDGVDFYNGDDIGRNLAIDSSGSLYLTGSYNGYFGFNASSRAYSADGTGPDMILTVANNNSVFLVKYDSDGTVQWVRIINASGNVLGYGVAVDSGSNVFMTGEYTADSEVNVGYSITLPTTTGVASFLVKYDTGGTTQWATKIDGSSTDKGVSVVTGKNGNVHLIGNYTSGAIIISPSITLPDTSGNDTMFLLTYDTEGVAQWATTIDGVGADVVTDSTGTLYITGSYSSPNSNVSNIGGKDVTLETPNGGAVFLVEYSPNGILRTSTHIDGTSNESGNALAVDSLGQNVCVSGTTGSNSVIYNSVGTPSGLTLTSGPGFVVKYEISKPLKLNVSSNLEVGTANLFVDTMTGRVGANTTTPQATLHVEGNVYASSNLEVGTANLFVDTQTSRVGVGTREPEATLHVEGNVYASSNLEVGTANLFVDTEVSRVGVRTRVPGYDLDVNGDINFTGDFYKNGVLFTAVIGSTPWSTLENNISYTAGNVSIGVVEPEATLHVEGNAYVSSNLEVSNINFTGSFNQNGTPFESSPWTTTGDDLSYTTGKVGVGTSSPDANLHVEGNAYVSSNLKVDTTTISTAVTDGVPTVSWATSIGGTGTDSGEGIATDSGGNVYVIGKYSGSVTIGSTTLTTVSVGSYDAFVAKYDTSGTVQWAKSIGGMSSEYGYGIATDNGGNVYVIGEYQGTATFAPGTTLTSASGTRDAFVAKYDTSGTVQWAKSIGGTSTDTGYGISTDSSGNVYVIGTYVGTLTIGSTTLDGTGNGDVFVAKYDTSGTDQWARSIGGTGPDYGYGIATDSSGNVFVTGRYRGGTITFAPDTTLTNAGPYTDDAFVAKYDTSGTVQWARGFGGGDYDNGYGIATDSSGNVYVTGGFTGSVTIGPGTTLTGSEFFENAFVAKYDTSGTAQWAKGITGQFTNARGYGITTDSDGNVYVTGYYYPTATFAPGTTLTSVGSYDPFVAKYDTSGTVQWATSIDGTGSDNGYGIATDSGGNVYVVGDYTNGSITIGSTTLTSAGTTDAFVAKYSPSKYLHINTGLEVGTANLHVDTVNSRVGIGTSTPEATLHVEGNVYMSSNLEVGTANLYVDTASGRVGIGKTDPGSALDVVGDVYVSSNLEVSNINFTGSFNQNGTPFESSPWTTTGNDLSYTTGKVGVGTSSPDANLHVEGDAYVSSNLEVGKTTISTPDQTPNVLWATSIGGTSFDDGRGIATDSNGNVYVIGYSRSSSITIGSTTLTNSGSYDVFVAKYDASGTVQWATSIGGTSADLGIDIATDSLGNVYLVGYYSGTATFGSTTLTGAGSYDVFVAKYDTSGTVQWATSIGGTDSEYGNGIATDSNGNVYVTGNYRSSITIGSTTLTNSGFDDVFVAKYDTSGTVQWATSIGGTSTDNGYGIATDSNGNVYVIGEYNSGSITIGSTTLTGAGSYDVFVAKYDTSGTVQWATSIGGTNSEYGRGIATDSNGNVYVIGGYSGTLTIGSTTLTGAGSNDAFVAKYDTSGTVQWATSIGGTSYDNGYGIATDSGGNVYVTGNYSSGSITIGSTTLTSAGSDDAFVAKYDTSGTVQWATSIGGTSTDLGIDIATDSNGNVYVIGNYYGSITIGSTTLTNSGSRDAFVVKYSSSPIYLRINAGLEVGTANLFVDTRTSRVGIGTTTPGYTLDVQGDLNVSGTTTNVSDKRLKSNVHVIENALEKVGKLSGYTFTMNNKQNAGVIAQEVLEVLPEVVGGSEETTYSVAYGNMASLFIEAIKELKREIEVLKTKD